MTNIIPTKKIESKIIVLRNQSVILDRDLAELYEVKTIALRQQVKRNIDRFPEDFMFQLIKHESEYLVSQNVIPSKRSLGGYLPYAFTENGVAMLSRVLNSKKAIQINIQIMRVFTSYARQISTYDELRKAIYALAIRHDEDIEHLSKLLFFEVDRFEKLIKPKNKSVLRVTINPKGKNENIHQN